MLKIGRIANPDGASVRVKTKTAVRDKHTGEWLRGDDTITTIANTIGWAPRETITRDTQRNLPRSCCAGYVVFNQRVQGGWPSNAVLSGGSSTAHADCIRKSGVTKQGVGATKKTSTSPSKGRRPALQSKSLLTAADHLYAQVHGSKEAHDRTGYAAKQRNRAPCTNYKTDKTYVGTILAPILLRTGLKWGDFAYELLRGRHITHWPAPPTQGLLYRQIRACHAMDA